MSSRDGQAGGFRGATAVVDHAVHTPYSDPGEHAALVTVLPIEPAALSAVARNLIVHYRASGHELPEDTRDEVNARWVEGILAADQRRHQWPLDRPREVTSRVQGCCRDHTLFCVATLRTHGVAARSRVGFAGYFVEGWHHDHVVVDAWLDGRWQRFDSEIDGPRAGLPTPMDIAPEPPGGSGFVTAAQVWAAYRRGDIDPDSYGVDPDMPLFRGPRFLFDEVIYEVAHRFGDEMLLWDAWGRIGGTRKPGDRRGRSLAGRRCHPAARRGRR
jgi:Transglutaminase-like superfamily